MDRSKRQQTLAFATAVIIGICSFTLFAEEQARKYGPGDIGYLHGKFHDLYAHLQYEVGGQVESCCSGTDCRVTLDLRPPTADQASRGVVGQVLVEGLWCPVSRSQLVDLPLEVKLRGNYDPHVQDFQNRTHVCAALPHMPFLFSDIPQLSPDLKMERPTSCPRIFCVKEGGAKS